jgi:L-threonate 2-dehydrogenase
MAKKQKGVVGIVGLGIMGGAFASNLHTAGWRVIGYDLDSKRRRALARAGIEIAADVGALSAAAPTIITSLPKASALAATVDAIVAAGARRRVVIEASTFKLEDKEAAEARLREAGHVLLDCPISGTGFQAKPRTLSSMPRAARPRSKSCARCSPTSRAPCTISAPSATAAK